LGVFTIVLIGVIRTRRARRYDIKPSEIHPDLAAGEDLLSDAMKEQERVHKDSAEEHGP